MTRAPEIERTRREGKRVRTGCLEVRVVASLHALPRVGLIVPKYKHSSVQRNLVKRRLREWVRLELLPALARITPPLDLMVRVSPMAYARTFQELGRDLQQIERQVRRLAATVMAPSVALPLAPDDPSARTDS